MNFMKHADICALDIPHTVLEIISFVYFSMAVHAYTIVHKCSPSPAERTSINKTFLREVIDLATQRISKVLRKMWHWDLRSSGKQAWHTWLKILKVMMCQLINRKSEWLSKWMNEMKGYSSYTEHSFMVVSCWLLCFLAPLSGLLPFEQSSDSD